LLVGSSKFGWLRGAKRCDSAKWFPLGWVAARAVREWFRRPKALPVTNDVPPFARGALGVTSAVFQLAGSCSTRFGLRNGDRECLVRQRVGLCATAHIADSCRTGWCGWIPHGIQPRSCTEVLRHSQPDRFRAPLVSSTGRQKSAEGEVLPLVAMCLGFRSGYT